MTSRQTPRRLWTDCPNYSGLGTYGVDDLGGHSEIGVFVIRLNLPL